jgi:UDP-2,3-diacylglucosamine pyrophosphatase LpxH
LRVKEGKIVPIEQARLCFIVSDLHLGSAYFQCEYFLSWLDALPQGAGLILNGDIVDEPRRPLQPEHLAVLDRLVRESHRRPVVWVWGNHDANFMPQDPGAIRFADSWEIGRRLLVVHGDDLDELMPRHGLFKWVFRKLHGLRLALGFRNVHVAEYAKKWNFLYRVLSNHVARNALRAARRLDFEAITCGHTHAAMEIEQGGRRYLNTGAWTEKPLYYLRVDAENIDLQVYEDGRA